MYQIDFLVPEFDLTLDVTRGKIQKAVWRRK